MAMLVAIDTLSAACGRTDVFYRDDAYGAQGGTHTLGGSTGKGGKGGTGTGGTGTGGTVTGTGGTGTGGTGAGSGEGVRVVAAAAHVLGGGFGVTSGRHEQLEANTPWSRICGILGWGISAASRAMSSIGAITRCVRPRRGVFNR